MAGFRGAVSLAAALAVPGTVASGSPFLHRDLIVFVTTGVIVVTLSQALLLPPVLRWARLPRDTGVDDERHLAEVTATEAALAALPEVAERLGTDPHVVDRTCAEYEQRLRLLHAGDDGARDELTLRQEEDHVALRLALLAHKRAAVLRLRDERLIDDTVLRVDLTRLEIEEGPPRSPGGGRLTVTVEDGPDVHGSPPASCHRVIADRVTASSGSRALATEAAPSMSPTVSAVEVVTGVGCRAVVLPPRRSHGRAPCSAERAAPDVSHRWCSAFVPAWSARWRAAVSGVPFRVRHGRPAPWRR